jgi:hypothetical protein
LASGTRSLIEVAAGFVGSPQFKARYSDGITDAEFVTLLYDNVLGRDPDEKGLARWTGDLADGASLASVVLGFSQSPQFMATTASDFEQWMRDQGEHDRIDVGAGVTTVSGGRYADVFVFDAADQGQTTVLDLEVWDLIELNGFGFGSGDDVREKMVEVGSSVVFEDQGVSIIFRNVDFDMISDDMIVL